MILPIPKETRDLVSSVSRSIFRESFGKLALKEHAACMQWSGIVAAVLCKQGYKAILQAGSAQWRFRDDDGENPDWFGYVYDSHAALARLQEGKMPEMHVWVGVVDEREPVLVDVTTRFQAKQAKLLHGFDWDPAYVMDGELYLPCREAESVDLAVRYYPNKSATILAIQLWENALKEIRGEKPSEIIFLAEPAEQKSSG